MAGIAALVESAATRAGRAQSLLLLGPRAGLRLRDSHASDWSPSSDSQRDSDSLRDSLRWEDEEETLPLPATGSSIYQRWESLMGSHRPRDAFYGAPPPRQEYNAPDVRVHMDELPDSTHTEVHVGDTLRATLSSRKLERNGVEGTERMGVLCAVQADGTAEVVYRRLTIEMEGERPRNVSESGSATYSAELLERAASNQGTSTASLLHSITEVGRSASGSATHAQVSAENALAFLGLA